MIASIKGTLKYLTEEQAIVENNGLGYEVIILKPYAQKLKNAVGSEAFFYIYHHFTESQQCLYGFETALEKKAFMLLLTVSSVGPKAAWHILSAFSVEEIVSCILKNTPELLSKAKGIGKKTAERIILELKEKIKNNFSELISQTTLLKKSKSQIISAATSDSINDAKAALLALGYKYREVETVFSAMEIDPQEAPEKIIKKVLAKM